MYAVYACMNYNDGYPLLLYNSGYTPECGASSYQCYDKIMVNCSGLWAVENSLPGLMSNTFVKEHPQKLL